MLKASESDPRPGTIHKAVRLGGQRGTAPEQGSASIGTPPQNGQLMKKILLVIVCLWSVVGIVRGGRSQDQALPLAVPDGFRVQLVADDRLAHDAFSMTIDAKGRPIVSGPGYIRTLFDRNNDGIFDSSEMWSSSIREGAQGLWYEEDRLYWVADKGLWTARDANMDGKADTPPSKLLNFPTGGEHDAHAIRRGPDGWWYLMVGNFANGIQAIKNDPNAPVERPRAGTIWRISPDFQRRGVWAHGLRNAYDFDFLPGGEIITYDSDDERAATLPWYRPTRVFLLTPGSDAGWVGQGWKDANVRVTMPRTLAELGRGSPTGVAVYRHRTFPEKYHQAAFILDWTFGRVIAVFPESQLEGAASAESRPSAKFEVFMQPNGSAGFAPTDLCIEPSGNLLVCVGGRGTKGAIYRISPNVPNPVTNVSIASKSNGGAQTNRSGQLQLTELQEGDLAAIVNAACPLESWSVSQWMPRARRLGANSLSAIASNRAVSSTGERLSEASRVSAIYALCRMQQPLGENDLKACLADSSPAVRIAAWFTLSRGASTGLTFENCREAMAGDNFNFSSGWGATIGDVELRAKLECCGLMRWPVTDLLPKTRNSTSDRSTLQNLNVRQVALWAHSQTKSSVENPEYEKLAADALYSPGSRLNVPLMTAISENFTPTTPRTESNLIEVFNVCQAALGDPRWSVEPQQDSKTPSAFDGYRSLFGSAVNTSSASWCHWLVRELKLAKKNNWNSVLFEGLRTAAMFEPNSAELMQFCLDQITDDSHPTSDIHSLLVLAQCQAPRGSEHSLRTAQALLQLGEKVRVLGLTTDNNWQPRMSELTRGLIARDDELPDSMIGSPQFGTVDHLVFAEQFAAPLKIQAQKKMAERIGSNPLQKCSPAFIRFVSASVRTPAWRDVLRQSADDSTLRSTVMELLAVNPEPQDHDVYLKALSSSDRSSWKFAWQGLSKLPAVDPQRELCCLAMLLARIKGSAEDIDVRLVLQRIKDSANQLRLPAPPTVADWKTLELYFQKHLPAETLTLIQDIREPSEAWRELIKKADNLEGNAVRGRLLYSQAKCEQCHQGQTSLGPDLGGAVKRFSKEDLFLAIYEPSQDISDRYRAHQILTSDGQIVVGLIVYDSPDRLMLLLADGSQVSFSQSDIEDRKIAEKSIMPEGLLDSFTPQQIADLYAFLKGL